MDKKSRVNKYTPEGRVEIHKNLSGVNMAVLYHLMNNPCGKQSVEYNDNRIALYVAQKGKCAVSGVELEANQVDCHHKKPLVLGTELTPQERQTTFTNMMKIGLEAAVKMAQRG